MKNNLKFEKGHIPWNKGKEGVSLETHNKMVEARKDKKNTDEQNKKISETLKSKGIIPWNTGMKLGPRTKEIKEKISSSHLGPKNPSWEGGITPINEKIKNSLRYKQWRQDCFMRDNFTCQECGQVRGGKLNVHHIIKFNILLAEAREYMPLLDIFSAAMLYSPLWDLINGITLCKECHRKEHRKEKMK